MTDDEYGNRLMMAILIDAKSQLPDPPDPLALPPLVDVYRVKAEAKPDLPGSERRAMEAVKALERDGLVKALYQTEGVFVQVTPEGWQEKPRYVGLGP